MSLLTNVMDHSLDDGYAEAAARTEADGAAGCRVPLRAKLGLAAGLVLAALVVTVGAAQARVAAPVVAKEREELIDRIDARDRGGRQARERASTSCATTSSARQREALKQQRRRPGRAGRLLSGRDRGARARASSSSSTTPRTADQGGDGGPARDAAASPTPAGCATATCSGSSTGCGSRAPRPSPSTASG